MSLSFLSKKTWHTSNIGNVEKVWIAEQQHEREAKKLKELQKQIDEERQIDELRGIQRDAGLVKSTAGSNKVEWMYEGPGSALASQQVAEDYKLGKKYDAPAAFTELHQLEDKSTVGSKWIDNKANDQNENFARLNADPLYAMRQAQKVEREKKVLSNPVQMKRIKQALTSELKELESLAVAKREKKSAKESKKAVKRATKDAKKAAKKQAKKKKKKKKADSSDSSSEDEAAAATSSKKRKAEEYFEEEEEEEKPALREGYGLKKGKKTEGEARDITALGPSKDLLAAKQLEEAARNRVAPKRVKMTEEELEQKRQEMANDGAVRDATRAKRMKGHETSDVKKSIQEDDAAKQRRALDDDEDIKADPKFLRSVRNEVYGEKSSIDLGESLQRSKNRHQKSKNRETFM